MQAIEEPTTPDMLENINRENKVLTKAFKCSTRNVYKKACK